jgi:beta-glucosidase
MRVLKLKNDLGLFENPFKDGSAEKEKEVLLCKEHRSLAREMAAKSFVLLKNEEILPLVKEAEGTVALIGPYADNVDMFGAWSFPKKPELNVTIKEGMETKGAKLVVSKGCFVQDEDKQAKVGQKDVYTKEELEALMAEAVEAAKNAETVVLCLGEHREYTGEGGSRADITLPKHQIELLHKVAEVNKNIVTVVFSGRPVVIPEVVEVSKAVLMVWMPGTEGGNAIADVLYGDTMPEGKLSMCLPRSVGQTPIFYNKFRTGRPNEEGTRVGFIHGYIDESIYPLFPFGYGLTYTNFEYSDVKLSKDTMTKEETLTATVTVTNTGKRTAVETVQMYLWDVTGSVVRPEKMLKGFGKVLLEPGECKEISFEITEEMLRFYNIDMEFVSEPGKFIVYIGGDSSTKNGAEFHLV